MCTLCEQNTLARHIFSCLRALVIIFKCLCASNHPCVMRLCVWSLFDPFFALFICLSRLLLHPPGLLPLPCGWCRSKIPCAPRRMRSLALWSTTPLSQVMIPTSSTTTTSQRPLKFSSRSPPASQGPRTCMTRRSVTTPSAS